jgi:tetratricopeptide (TPR) repeat protein
MRTIVLDTNVLLSDPEVLDAYPGAEIILPDTVLAELDKIKTSRADADLRYRGRSVSRVLFELSEKGPLAEGVKLPNGGELRVVHLDSDFETPEGLSLRNADDRILAVALQVCQSDCEQLTLVTNDLNMLLKAQGMGIEVERHDGGVDESFARRYIIRPFQRYRIPIAILALAVAVFAAIVVLTLVSRPSTSGGSGSAEAILPEFRGVLSEQQGRILDLLIRVEENPNDLDAVLSLANEYYDMREHTGSVAEAELALSYYERYLQARPDSDDVRVDLAITKYVLGDTDEAIQEVTVVLSDNPDHVNANYNLGIFYWQGREDLPLAATQFRNVIELTEGSDDTAFLQVNEFATRNLEQLLLEAADAGIPIPDEGDA